MKKLSSKFLGITFGILSVFLCLFLTGCGDNDMAGNITDAVKKSVESEVAQKADEIKKQIDQLIIPGSGSSGQENKQSATNADKEESAKGSGEKPEEDDD
ncbi:MAG TPA: hypothetical protein PK425_02470 [Syntrophales bacterium]|jgi:imidazoleglycerol phosphate synthase glutamine amidotransferase subunit HisH|nr:hypothetical protein [Syntrophales bacterium]HPX55380.1 hypothetical protein [Syntrophales bacterium]HQA82915.1 hypothetical protein [Syntrophales bacterium]